MKNYLSYDSKKSPKRFFQKYIPNAKHIPINWLAQPVAPSHGPTNFIVPSKQRLRIILMYRPSVTALILVFAAVANSWLFFSKVLPTITSRAPPGYQSIYTPAKNTSSVAWTIMLNDDPVGSALSVVEPGPFGTISVWSNLQLDDLPLNELLPPWASTMLGTDARKLRSSIKLDAFGYMTINRNGELQEFQSIVKVPGVRQAVHLSGTITPDNKVTVSLRSGDFEYETSRQLPNNFSIRDELSPQATMAGISQGQRWTVPIYSPLRPTRKPIEILYASVAGHEVLYFNNQLVNTHIVSYRTAPNDHQPPRSRMWIGPRGEVLQHESTILGSKLLFLRRPVNDTLSSDNKLSHIKSLFEKADGFSVTSSQVKQ